MTQKPIPIAIPIPVPIPTNWELETGNWELQKEKLP
jgi:hypothetical protein